VLRKVGPPGMYLPARAVSTGTNKTSKEPVLINRLPPSLRHSSVAKRVQFYQVVCGGAHTAVIAYIKALKPTVASPWGIKTVILSWGYGRNGQLGHGKLHSITFL
jgi:hypothetical protein